MKNKVYSSLLDRYIPINEVEIAANNTSTATKDTANTSLNSAIDAKGNAVAGNDRDAMNRYGSARGASDAYNSKNAGTKELEATIASFKEEVNMFKTLAGYVFSSQSNAVLGIYKDYMDILRTHVRDYVGVASTENDKQPQKGTQYDTGNNQQQQAPQQNQQQGQG